MTHKELEKYKADRAVQFINFLKHTKGKWAGTQFKLEDWQEKIVRDIFGTLNEDGTRQYRTVYIEIPRKNGKSELAATIALYLLFADGEAGAEVYGAAGDRDQASIVYHVAASMVEYHKDLSAMCRILYSTRRILIKNSNSYYHVLSSDDRTKHGYNAHGIIFDELHVQPNRMLWDVLSTSGGTRAQPLIFAITTAGYDKESICWEQHDYARQILDGVIEDPTFYPVIYCADEDDDWQDEKVWYKANPALGSFRSIEEMQAMYDKAKNVPPLQNTFRRLYLNQWTSQETRWLDVTFWEACRGKLSELKGRRCFAGLDLSSTTDISALVLVFPFDDGHCEILPFFWIPRKSMHDREIKDRVPYSTWVREGLIEATPGDIIDYDFIERKLEQLGDEYRIEEIGFDRWGATLISTHLQDMGFTVTPVGQGYASMSPAVKEVQKVIMSRKLKHDGNPVMRWMFDNVAVRMDPAENIKFDKAKATKRIDGMVALAMAIYCMVNSAGASVYEDRGLISL